MYAHTQACMHTPDLLLLPENPLVMTNWLKYFSNLGHVFLERKKEMQVSGDYLTTHARSHPHQEQYNYNAKSAIIFLSLFDIVKGHYIGQGKPK